METELSDGKVTLKIIEKKLKGLYEIIPVPHKDERGYMCRLFDEKLFAQAGLTMKCVQESKSHTEKKNTIRGFHVSLPPHLEGKTITAIRGKMKWIAIDVRKNSKTFGKWESVILSDELNNTLYAEPGFAHGCISLTNNCDLLLRANTYYQHGTGINWKDPELNVDWDLKGKKPIISERDNNYASFTEFKKKYSGV